MNRYVKLFTVLLFLIFLSISLKGQIKIHGQVQDSTTKQGIAFATIGIKDRIIGTVADSAGHFQLEIPKDSIGTANPLIISCIGYKSIETASENLIGESKIIQLSPLQITLNQVVVKPEKFKVKTFGRTGSSAFMSTKMISEHNHTSDELGKEIGTVINIDKNCLLTAFNMHVIFNHFDNIKFRLNIYSVRDGLPDTLIIKDNILLDVGHIRQQWVNVDLTKYQIYLQDYEKVAVTIQWVKSQIGDDQKKSFNISAIPSASKYILFRDKSQSTWLKVRGDLSMNLTAESFKK